MQEPTLIANKDIAWAPHPQFAGVRLAWLMRRFLAGTPPLSCALVQIPPEARRFPEHLHAHEPTTCFTSSAAARACGSRGAGE